MISFTDFPLNFAHCECRKSKQKKMIGPFFRRVSLCLLACERKMEKKKHIESTISVLKFDGIENDGDDTDRMC